MGTYVKTNTHFLSYDAQFCLKWGTLQIKVVEKIKTHISCSITLRNWYCIWDNVEKYCTVRQVTNDKMEHWHYMPDTQDYKYIVFSLQQRLHKHASVLHCLSCLFSCEEASIIGVIRIRRIRQQDMQETYGMWEKNITSASANMRD
jgi:hypothetical protein